MRGGDEVGREVSRQIGGCAFNVARSPSRLGIAVTNGIPVGNGAWGKEIADAMKREKLIPLLRNESCDNGQCLAIVEPYKERAFITVEGREQHWTSALLARLPVGENAIIYVSGYELANKSSRPLKDWLLTMGKDKTLFVDFGPRLADIDAGFQEQLFLKKPILTLNEDELALLLKTQADISSAMAFSNQHDIKLICRFDKEGAWVIEPHGRATRIAPYSVKAVVDTIGAGDGHCAGTLAGMAAHWALDRAVQLGNMVAAIVVGHPGANGAPTREELIAFNTLNA